MNFLLSLMSKLKTLSISIAHQFLSTLPFFNFKRLGRPLLDQKITKKEKFFLSSLQTMSHSLNPASSPLAATAATSSKSSQKTLPPSIAGILRARQQIPDDKLIGIHRRSVALGLVIGSLSLGFGEQSATAAARRPPAPPPEEKKDPNVSGVQAKVLASKKRKEAMKESIAKLREKGKPVNQSSE